MTPFNDGTFLVSSGGKPDMLAPDSIQIRYRRGTNPATLWNFHKQQLANEFGATGVMMRGPTDIRETSERYHAEVRDFHLDRGAFGEPIDQEIELPPMPKAGERPSVNKTTNRASLAKKEDLPDDDLVLDDEPSDDDLEVIEDDESEEAARTRVVPERYAEVLAHLKKQQEKSGWGMAIVILVVTGLLYVGLGAAQWDWKFVAILIPVLMFHEAGHLIAMWTFGYRNLKMFFIPFLGAAASGRNHNVAGWKKALVALAGPLPGIGLGCIVGMTGAVIENELMIEIGLISLLLNVFNLLPFMPLDGGWNLHAVLFSRHPLLDAVFRALAAIGCLGLSIGMQAKGLMWTGFWMLIGIGPSYRCAKIAARLRQEGVEFEPTDDGSIPLDAVARIVEELQESSKAVDNKVLATLTTNVYETLNSKPPGWFATLSLLFLHASTFVVAIAFICILYVSKQGGLLNVAQLAADPPAHSFSCGTLSTWHGPQFDHLRTTPHNTIVVTLKDEATASQLFLQLQGQLPVHAGLKRLSRQLLVSLPDNNEVRQKWLTQLEQHDPHAFVLTAEQGTVSAISFVAPTEDAAPKLEQELQEYFSASSMQTIPPWQNNDRRNQAERDLHRKARRTYLRCLKVINEPIDDPELKDLQKQQVAAARRQDNAKIQELTKRSVDLRHQHQRARLEQLKNTRDPELDADVIDTFTLTQLVFEPLGDKPTDEQFNQHQLNHQRRQLAIGKLLGQFPMEDDKPVQGADRDAANYGHAQRAGMLFRLSIHYRDLFEGLPATAEWLCARGCIDIKFNARAIGGEVDDE